MKHILLLPGEVLKNRKLVLHLARNDFKTKYAGSYLGIMWAFVQPVVTILVYWFVFSVGFRADAGDLGIPFVLYLVSGIIPWFFFQDALNGGTNAFVEYSYLVKKVVFKISLLPVVKVISAAFVHMFFVLFTLVLFTLYGYKPSVYELQLVYYFFCTFMLVLGLVYLTSAIVVFFRDLREIISILLQVFIWLAPIMWVAETALKDYPFLRRLLLFNPMYYVVNGYREALIWKHWFFQRPVWTLYFWGCVAVLFAAGSFTYHRLKPHFADVL